MSFDEKKCLRYAIVKWCERRSRYVIRVPGPQYFHILLLTGKRGPLNDEEKDHVEAYDMFHAFQWRKRADLVFKRNELTPAFFRVVYFIADPPFLKIGQAADPFDRIDKLQTGNPRKLTVVGDMEAEDPRQAEKSLHARFADERAIGEWFRMSERLCSFVRESATNLYKPELLNQSGRVSEVA